MMKIKHNYDDLNTISIVIINNIIITLATADVILRGASEVATKARSRRRSGRTKGAGERAGARGSDESEVATKERANERSGARAIRATNERSEAERAEERYATVVSSETVAVCTHVSRTG